MITASMVGSDLTVPLSEFEFLKKDQLQFRNYLVVQNDQLLYPVGVYRLSSTNYTALWMRCTHQGTELQAFGDKLHCPAHGSEFNKSGGVENGPAENPLRTFPVVVADGQLKISLK
jgi:Rieske Fe-S protein